MIKPMTPEEANKKRCPFSAGRLALPDRDNETISHCEADQCMAWSYLWFDKTKGWCGMLTAADLQTADLDVVNPYDD
jgi:hypothetical protein